MENSRKAYLIFKKILIFLFIIFIINYISVGWYGYRSDVRDKTILTQEKIEEFEEDVKNNQYVDIKDYIESDDISTRSLLSDATYKFTEVFSDIITNKAVKLFKLIEKLFT